MRERRYVIWWWWTNGGGPVIEPDQESVRVFGVADDDGGDVVYGPVVRAGVLRCRLWSLVHGHGWDLPVVKSLA